jgi:hypothetical protein
MRKSSLVPTYNILKTEIDISGPSGATMLDSNSLFPGSIVPFLLPLRCSCFRKWKDGALTKMNILQVPTVFRIAHHVRADICNRPCLCLVQALLKTPRPSVDLPLAKLDRRSFLIRHFRRFRPLKNDDGLVQEALETPRPRSDATKKVADVTGFRTGYRARTYRRRTRIQQDGGHCTTLGGRGRGLDTSIF